MKTIAIRFPDDVHEQLVAAAEDDVRSLNGEAIYLLRLALGSRQTRAAAEERMARSVDEFYGGQEPEPPLNVRPDDE